MDADTTQIVLLVLQIVLLILQTVSAYQASRKLVSAPTKRAKKEELAQSVSFVVQRHETLDQRTKDLHAWLDALLTAKNIAHSSSGGQSE